MSKLLKVTFEFDDKTQSLEGEEAECWLDALNSTITLSYVHGIPFPEFKWLIIKTEKEKQ